MKTLLIFGCATVVASAFGPATTAGAQNDRYREKFDTAVTMGRGGSVRISVYSGHVNVVGVSGSRVRVRGFVDRGEFKFDSHSGSVRMDVEPDGRHGGNAELDITVPIGTRVQIDGFSAPYSVKGVKGEVKLESMSGSVEVAGAVGRTSIATVSGNILANDIEGDLRAESVSGRDRKSFV